MKLLIAILAAGLSLIAAGPNQAPPEVTITLVRWPFT
jgi:hypothetical protein